MCLLTIAHYRGTSPGTTILCEPLSGNLLAFTAREVAGILHLRTGHGLPQGEGACHPVQVHRQIRPFRSRRSRAVVGGVSLLIPIVWGGPFEVTSGER
jgi:hypothetical protein